MADVKWVKITTDMFDNRKIKYLRKLPDGNNIVLIWVMLLTMAGRCNANGMIFLTENIPYTPKMLADELDFEENTVKLALASLEKMNMVVTDGDFFSIAGWAEYQNLDGMEKIREQNRLRKQKQREQVKLPPVNNTSRDGHVTVTLSHATEEEGEEDSEEEKENSFYHSAEKTDFLKEETKRKYLGGSLGKGVVLLSDEQINDLLEKLSIEEFDHYVSVVADCELSGKPFKKKTHYKAILDMAAKDRGVK